MLTTIKNKI